MVLSGARVQELLEKLPPLVSEVNVTVPVGAAGLDAVSVTAAVQDVAWPIATGSGCGKNWLSSPSGSAVFSVSGIV